MDLNNIGILEQIVLENATQPLRRTNKKYLKKLNQYNSDIAIETINLLHQANSPMQRMRQVLQETLRSRAAVQDSSASRLQKAITAIVVRQKWNFT